jgi:single-stranded DNA-binding protein
VTFTPPSAEKGKAMEDKKKYPFGSMRGEAIVRVGTAPETKSFAGKDGRTFDVTTLRAVCTPYNGKRELEDQWVTLRFVGSEHAKKLEKGDVISVHGAIRVDQWTGKDGTVHSSLEMNVSRDFDGFLVVKRKNPLGGEAEGAPKPAATPAAKAMAEVVDDDEIPF